MTEQEQQVFDAAMKHNPKFWYYAARDQGYRSDDHDLVNAAHALIPEHHRPSGGFESATIA